MTSSISFGRRGVRAPATWPSAPAPPRDEPSADAPRQSWSSPPAAAKREKAPRADDGSPSGLIWLLFGFEGRIRRNQYWLVWIAVEALSMLMTPLQFANLASEMQGHVDLPRLYLVAIVSFVFLWIELAIKVKRWHDRDKSWFWALFLLVPLVGWLWAFIECGFFDGTPGPNRFGPSPKGVAGPAVEKDLSAYGIY